MNTMDSKICVMKPLSAKASDANTVPNVTNKPERPYPNKDDTNAIMAKMKTVLTRLPIMFHKLSKLMSCDDNRLSLSKHSYNAKAKSFGAKGWPVAWASGNMSFQHNAVSSSEDEIPKTLDKSKRSENKMKTSTLESFG